MGRRLRPRQVWRRQRTPATAAATVTVAEAATAAVTAEAAETSDAAQAATTTFPLAYRRRLSLLVVPCSQPPPLPRHDRRESGAGKQTEGASASYRASCRLPLPLRCRRKTEPPHSPPHCRRCRRHRHHRPALTAMRGTTAAPALSGGATHKHRRRRVHRPPPYQRNSPTINYPAAPAAAAAATTAVGTAPHCRAGPRTRRSASRTPAPLSSDRAQLHQRVFPGFFSRTAARPSPRERLAGANTRAPTARSLAGRR